MKLTAAAAAATLLFAAAASPGAVAEALFESRQLTATGEYPDGIEGPAVDAAGNLYVVNLGQKGTIGRVRPGASTSELFATLPDGSIGNGIRFDREGRMYVADFKAHTIFVLEPGQATPRPYFPRSRGPACSTSRTTSRSPPTERFMQATRNAAQGASGGSGGRPTAPRASSS